MCSGVKNEVDIYSHSYKVVKWAAALSINTRVWFDKLCSGWVHGEWEGGSRVLNAC